MNPRCEFCGDEVGLDKPATQGISGNAYICCDSCEEAFVMARDADANELPN